MTSKQTQALKEAVARGMSVTPEGTVIGILGKTIIPWKDSRGYFIVGINIEGKKEVVSVHRLQAYQKYGNLIFEEGKQVRHLNGNPLDNSADNIALGTSSENNMDKPAETRVRVALLAASKKRVLSCDEVKDMREKRKKGYTTVQLAKIFKVSQGNVSDICNRKLYKNVL